MNTMPFGVWQNLITQLKASQALAIVAVLFVLDLFLPDPIPVIDEVILGLLVFILARWKQRKDAVGQTPMKNVTPRH